MRGVNMHARINCSREDRHARHLLCLCPAFVHELTPNIRLLLRYLCFSTASPSHNTSALFFKYIKSGFSDNTPITNATSVSMIGKPNFVEISVTMTALETKYVAFCMPLNRKQVYRWTAQRLFYIHISSLPHL